MAGEVNHFARGAMRTSKRLIFSYVLDWIFIVAIAALGVVFNQISASTKRPFNLQDPSLNYPYRNDTVTVTVAGIVALVVPAAVMFVICMTVVPGAGAPRGTPASLIWRRKLWEWNTSWMGLALSCATAFMITEGLKDLAGRPRPHAIAVCRPNIDNLESPNLVSILGGVIGVPEALEAYGSSFPIRVTAGTCTNTDPHQLRDAFASWPSGHSSFSFAGLLYFSFFLSAKFAVTIPFLNPISYRKQRLQQSTFVPAGHPEHSETTLAGQSGYASHENHAPRNQAAAPPVYLLVIVFIPIGAAIFICVSRWFDYHHHATDILSGALLGIFTAWFSYRYFHMPIRRGSGWSWGPRSRSRAFWIGVGREGYVGDEGFQAARYDTDRVRAKDLEVGSSSLEKSRLSAGDASREHEAQALVPAEGSSGTAASSNVATGAGRYDINDPSSTQEYGRAV